MINTFTTSVRRRNALLLIILLLSCSKSYSQAPLKDWYRGYFPDEDRQGSPIAQGESGEDWFYDIKDCKDIKTGKVDGFVCVGYQRYQCSYAGTGTDHYCGTVLHDELRDNVQNASVNNFGTLWFLDLYGNEKWYVDIGEDYSSITDPIPWVELLGVIQTYDGDFVVVGDAARTTGVYLNPNGSTPTLPTYSDNNRVFVAKVSKTTHSVVWQYVYDMTTTPGGADHYNSLGFDIVEDPSTHQLVIASRSNNGSSSISDLKMSIYVLDENGILLGKNRFNHYDGTNYWNSYSIGTSIVYSPINGSLGGSSFYCAGRTENGGGCSGSPQQSFVVHFEVVSGVPTFINSAVIAPACVSSVAQGSFSWDIAQLNNNDLVLPVYSGVVSNDHIYNDGYIYKLDPVTLAPTLCTSTSLGEFRAYDLENGIRKTKDGGFVFQSTKRTSPISISNPLNLTMADGFAITFGTGGYSTALWNTDVYLAKFDGSCNLEWENTYPFTDYDPTVTIRGDIKKQECLYTCIQHPDGGYMSVGNNSSNLDDHTVLKTFSECSGITSYDIGTGSTSTSYETLTGTQTWTTDKTILGTLVIQNGEVLTVDGATISFADTRETGIPTRIRVEVGGKLSLINGAKLTSICSSTMWDGIQLFGDPTKEQSPTSNQGYIYMENSTIERARKAITTFEHFNTIDMDGAYEYLPINNGPVGGGLIVATNAAFINNSRDVELFKYVSPTLIGNKSKFTNCRFEVDDDIPYDFSMYHQSSLNEEGTIYKGKEYFVVLKEVRGVNFHGCEFTNNKTDLVHQRGIGIYGISSTFIVDDFLPYPWSVTPVHSTFSKLYTGIECDGLSSILNPLKIYNTRMDDVRHGILVSGANLPTPTILFNEIILNPDKSDFFLVNGFTDPAFGIHLTGCDRYVVEENRISVMTPTTTPVDEIIGIAINNRHGNSTQIYRNYLNGVNKGIMAFGKNGVPSPTDQGLLIKCNQHTDIISDDIILQNDYINQGIIKLNQGECQGTNTLKPAGNTFSTTSTYQIGGDVGISPFTYKCHNSSSFIPSTYSSDVTLNVCGVTSTSYSCPANYTISDGTIGATHTKGEVKVAIAQSADDIDAIISDPDTQPAVDALRTELNYFENLYFSDLLDEDSSTVIITYLEGKPNRTIGDSLLLATCYIANGQWSDATNLLGIISSSDSDIVGRIWLLNEEINLYSNGNSWYNEGDVFLDSIAALAEDINLHHGIIAENIFRLIRDKYYNYRVPTNEESKSQAGATVNNLKPDSIETFIVYPNPTFNEFSIKIPEGRFVNRILVIDLLGSTIFEDSRGNKGGIQRCNYKLKSGAYFVKVIYADGVPEIQKLIIK